MLTLRVPPFPLVFDVEPDLIREGGTIPVARTFQDVTGKSIIMLPIGGFDDGLHSQNEKMSRSVSSVKAITLFLFNVIMKAFEIVQVRNPSKLLFRCIDNSFVYYSIPLLLIGK